MRRWALVVAALVLVVVGGRIAYRHSAERPVLESLGDLLMDLQVIPLDGEAPPAFRLDALVGPPVALADLRGRPALLYFWATW